MTTREPLWTEMDRAEILALALYRDSRCPCGCGNDVRDTTDSASRWRARKVRCLAREALAAAQQAHKTSTPEAVLWRAEFVGKG